MQYDDYEDLMNGLSNLPITWYPSLLIRIIKIIINKKIFINKQGILSLVNKVLKED